MHSNDLYESIELGVNMDIEKILEYQKLDFAIYKANKEFINSNENKRAVALRKMKSDLTDSFGKLDKEAGEDFVDVNKAIAQFEAFNAKLKSATISGAKTIEQAEKIDETIGALIAELSAIQKDLQKAFRRLQEINSKEAVELKQKFTKVVSELKNAEVERANVRSKILESINAEGQAIRKMQDELNPDDLKLYNRVKSTNIRMPYVVEYQDGSCMGCGIEIKTEVDSKLQNPGDIAECPNCRRIVYKK